MKYKNSDLYNYILKVDSESDLLHEVYQKTLSILNTEGLEKDLSYDMKQIFIGTFKTSHDDTRSNTIYELDRVLETYINLFRVEKNEDNSYVVYPKLKETPTKDDLLMFYCLKKNMNTQEIIDYLKPKNKAFKEELKQGKIEPYYGNSRYLILHTKAIYDAIELLSKRNDIENKGLVLKTQKSVEELLLNMTKTANLEYTDDTFRQMKYSTKDVLLEKEQYDTLRNLYTKVLEKEDNLIDISSKIWKDYETYEGGLLIHQLTGAMVESYKMNKICTSFYSEQAKVLINYHNTNTGYAYPMDINHIFTICEEDVGSWTITKEDFIDRDLPSSWQLDGKGIRYEYPYNTRLFPPEYIENKVKNNDSFAEIIIDNKNDKVKPSFCFYTENASLDQKERITDLAKKQNLNKLL